MAKRHFPVRPNLEQLKHQAKDLLRAFRRGDAEAVEDFREHQAKAVEAESARLADAQFVLARSYALPSWPRLVTACRMTDAIWRGDVEAVRKMVRKDPKLIVESARGVENCNWGPPLSYAANVSQDAIIEMLRSLGASDLEYAFGRACLQGQRRNGAQDSRDDGLPPGRRMACYPVQHTRSTLRAQLCCWSLAHDCTTITVSPLPTWMLSLRTDSRNPAAKHRILELYAEYGFKYPDTPIMALHRGRIDLLEEHIRHDPSLLKRTFSHEEIFPPELGCHDEVQATHGTPLAGTTLLHVCADYDEIEIARWLLDRGMNVDERARVDAEGFGGQTALFGNCRFPAQLLDQSSWS